MNNYKDSTPSNKPWPLWRWIMTGLIILDLVLSAIMSWHYLADGSMAGCGDGSPCQQVLNSRWSTIMGIMPVSGLAMGVYFAVFVASLFIGQTTELSVRRLAWSVMLILAGSVAGSAIWYTIIQKWFIRDFCPYCMATHMTGLLLAVLIIWRSIKEYDVHSLRNIFHPLRAMGLVLSGLVLAGLLAAFQIGLTPRTVYTDGESQGNLPVIDYNTVPVVGSPDAPYVVTLLFDYQCSHCQKIHFMLDEVIRRYDGKLAFVMCPVPLDPECNPYIPRDVDAFKNSCELARIGLTIWVASKEAFPVFENWMFTFESGDSWRPRNLENAMEKAVELVGQAVFDAARTNPWIEQYLQTCTQIYGRTIQNGRGGIPKLIFGPRWVIPQPYNADDLFMILQESLAVPLP